MNLNWPKISVITPSYNQAQYIELTIQTIHNQNYPKLEHIVIDGGSTDGTLDILKKYDGAIIWVSEQDKGQSDAINKGLRRATGDIVTFLNSDDLYENQSLHIVGEYFRQNPEAMWLSGQCKNINENGEEIRSSIRAYKNFWLKTGSYKVLQVLNYISQPATFWRRDAMQKVGYLDETLYYTMDYEYWLRLGKHFPLHVYNEYLASFRIHQSSKSGTTFYRQFDEELQVASRYSKGILLGLHRIHRHFAIAGYRFSFKGKD